MALPAIPGGDYKLSGGAGGAAGPSNALTSANFDNSGWNVNFGGGKISTTDAGDLGQYLPFIAIAAALLIGYRMTRRNK